MAQVSFRGNIGKVRGLQFSADGKPRFSFSVAEGHGKFDQNNQWQDTGTTWWNVTVFGRQAEDWADILEEGKKQQVTIAGRSQTRFYESNGEQRSSLDVIADNVGLVHRAPQGGQAAPQAAPGGAWGNQPVAPVVNAWTGQPQGGPAPF